MIAPEPSYQRDRADIWVFFDLRDKSAVKSLHLRRGALQELGDLEFIDEDHTILIARPGSARRLEV